MNSPKSPAFLRSLTVTDFGGLCFPGFARGDEESAPQLELLVPRQEIDPALATLRNLNRPDDYHSALRDACFDPADPAETTGRAGPPRVTIELFGMPRLRAGVGKLTVEAATVGAALDALAKVCPALEGSVLAGGTLHPAYTLNLNGERFVADPGTPLADGESLILLTVDVGG